jgi:addiction module HigA family antidote
VTSRERRLVDARPIGPGDVLRTRFLAVSGLTQDRLAEAMKVSRFSVNQIINGRRSVTAEMAIRLSHVTSTTPIFWLNLQRDVDLYEAELKLASEMSRLKVLRPAKSDDELFVDVD